MPSNVLVAPVPVEMVGVIFRLEKKIGSGSFGDIYLGTNTISGEKVAVKLEAKNTLHPQLKFEYKLYKRIGGESIGFPKIHWGGVAGKHTALVMNLLGSSLDDALATAPQSKFTLRTALLIAEQLLNRLEYLHSRNFIHRDLKPANILLGRSSKKTNEICHLIDFGLAKKYRDRLTHKHISFTSNINLVGTMRYASINAHKGYQQSRRDDLESLGYVLVHFLRGSMPWSGIKAKTKKEHVVKVMQIKQKIPLSDLCANMPHEFITYLEYARKLEFEEKPNYNYLRGLFKNLFLQKGYVEGPLFSAPVKI